MLTQDNFNLLSQRLEVLEKQIALLLLDNTQKSDIKEKKEKKSKKKLPDSSVNEPLDKPKQKRVSGYLVFSSAMREDVKKHLFADDKPKNSEIMVELGKRWKQLTDEEREEWNLKAKNNLP